MHLWLIHKQIRLYKTNGIVLVDLFKDLLNGLVQDNSRGKFHAMKFDISCF